MFASKTPQAVVVAEVGPPPEPDADAATAACVAPTEAEARRSFAVAQVGLVRTATVGDGFGVDGDVVLRSSWSDMGERRAFRCVVDAHSVSEVTIDGLRLLLTAGPPEP
ncbi:MAG TPA: hypothetical protein VF695_12350 [Sphingomonas sp.]